MKESHPFWKEMNWIFQSYPFSGENKTISRYYLLLKIGGFSHWDANFPGVHTLVFREKRKPFGPQFSSSPGSVPWVPPDPLVLDELQCTWEILRPRPRSRHWGQGHGRHVAVLGGCHPIFVRWLWEGVPPYRSWDVPLLYVQTPFFF